MTLSLHEIASKLISFDTVSSKSNLDAISFISGFLESAGMRVAIQATDFSPRKGNLLAYMGPPTPEGLIISGHIDTVPFEDQTGWKYDPLKLTIGDERVCGRGTSDMKIFLAQMLYAASLLERGVTLKRPLVFAVTYDEEVGCMGAWNLAPKMQQLLGEVPMPSRAWIGEPTSGRIFHAHKGSVVFKINAKGRAAHSSDPGAGINAISAMARAVELVDDYASELTASSRERFADIFPNSAFPTINIGTIRGGGTLNIVPEQCSVDAYYRYLPGDDPLELYREIGRRLQATPIVPRGPSAGPADVSLGGYFMIPGMLSTRDIELESALSDAMSTAGSTGAPFGSDGCVFCSVGIQSLVCGPGDIEEAHQPNESISRRAFECGHTAILSVINKVCC